MASFMPGSYASVGAVFYEMPIIEDSLHPTLAIVGKVEFQEERAKADEHGSNHDIIGTYTDWKNDIYPFTQKTGTNELTIANNRAGSNTINPFARSHITSAINAYRNFDDKEVKQQTIYTTRQNIKPRRR